MHTQVVRSYRGLGGTFFLSMTYHFFFGTALFSMVEGRRIWFERIIHQCIHSTLKHTDLSLPNYSYVYVSIRP